MNRPALPVLVDVRSGGGPFSRCSPPQIGKAPRCTPGARLGGSDQPLIAILDGVHVPDAHMVISPIAAFVGDHGDCR